MLSLYLEAQTLLDGEAKGMISSIEDWYRRAIEKEFNLFAIDVGAAALDVAA